MKKIWVVSLFGRLKAVVPDLNKPEEVQIVGHPFGSYPNGKWMEVPIERQEVREVGA